MYDVIIIGGGPAAVAAAVYTARKQLKTLMIAESFGGQSQVSDDIQNWIGEQHISGMELAQKLEAHVRSFPKEIEIKIGERANSIQSIACNENHICDFEVATNIGAKYQGKTLILALGARRRRLEVPGEKEFAGKGVSYCSTCDAPLFKNKRVAVIGGGNAGLEAVIDLIPYAKHIFLLHKGGELRADPPTQSKINQSDKVEIILNASTARIIGDQFVAGLEYQDANTGELKKLDIEGIFVEIGSVPNSDIVKDLVALDSFGQVQIDFKYATTSHLGIFAAGDITNDPFKQNNISVGDGVRAALSAYAYLQDREKRSPAEEKNINSKS